MTTAPRLLRNASSTLTALVMMACGGGAKDSGAWGHPGAVGAGGAHPDAGGSAATIGSTAGGDAGGLDEGCVASAGATALCLTFSPEQIAAEAEPGLDQRGFLSVQVFDTATPPAGDAASAAALYDRTFPADFETGGELAIGDLPAPRIVLPDDPPVVYVRALFFDHGSFTKTGGIGWGTWLGGLDLSRGLALDTGLLPIPLNAGEVTTHDVPLLAYRRLTVTVTTSASPLGDGEGALSVLASRVEGLPPNVPTHGYGIDPCVDVTRGPQAVDVVLLGSGTFYVTGFFDDLGIETPGEMPPGTMLSIDNFDPLTGEATYDQVTLAESQYSAALSIDLGYVTEYDGDPSTLGPNSCADLGLPGTP